MAIQAYCQTGTTALTVNGLHQWDYGQTLEVCRPDLPALLEIHFACAGMREAVVRSVTAINGVASAAIPDRCLEQMSPVVAWVYGVDETSGRTLLTITLPIIARAKPATAATVPQYIGDKYTELVAAINKQVEALKAGDVMAQRAYFAEMAGSALYASKDQEQRLIHETYGVFSGRYTECVKGEALPGEGEYRIRVNFYVGSDASVGKLVDFGTVYWDGAAATYARGGTDNIALVLEITGEGFLIVNQVENPEGCDGPIMYKKVWEPGEEGEA